MSYANLCSRGVFIDARLQRRKFGSTTLAASLKLFGLSSLIAVAGQKFIRVQDMHTHTHMFVTHSL